MLDTEGRWSEALASNNIRAIIRWLRKLTAEGEGEQEEILQTFSCWVQRTSEFAKKELLTLCFSRCKGLWMFLDRSAFSRVHTLLQRLRNLLTLAQWATKQLGSAHLWHGVGVPCVVCRDTFDSSEVRRGCWNREHRALEQHIWLGQLVQWWGIMGLLPKYAEAQEVRRISQLWKDMAHSQQKACLETPGRKEGEMARFQSLIQGIVTQLNRQHGCIWVSEDCTDQCYPPPNLQALLKLVLVPHIDKMSVEALLMYFVLDTANFLQCKDNLLQSFCHAFSIPSCFSQQIKAFWMLDHGQIKASMELLLSPRAAAPCLTWQHRCIIHCLLTRKQPQLALKYLHWTSPAMESVEDVKLCADVLLQNSCISEAWALLKRGHTESDEVVLYFLQACNGLGLCAEALKCIPAGYHDEGDIANGTTGFPLIKKDMSAERPPCPLSAKLYQAQSVNTVLPAELVQLVRKAVMEVRTLHPKISEVAWPEHDERKSNSREMFLSTQALRHLTPSPSPLDVLEETVQTAHTDLAVEKQPVSNVCIVGVPKINDHNSKSLILRNNDPCPLHLFLSQQQPEPPESISSSEDLSSENISSLTSASSLPLLRRDRAYEYKSTATLQRISSLLTDGENQSSEEEEEEESGTSFPHFPEMTADGATDPIVVSNSNTDVVVELVLSAEELEDIQTHVFSSETSGPLMDENVPVKESCRLHLPPELYSNEVSQSGPSLCECVVESNSFLSPNYEKMACTGEDLVHGHPDVSDFCSSALSLHQEDQSDCTLSQMFNFSEADISDFFMEKEVLKTYEPDHQEEAAGCFNQDLSWALSETTQDLLTDLHHSLHSRIQQPQAQGI
ncbi:protein ELYS-like isoform X1 [Eleginops maclovinus]|uniref:protein ELYS-like isoform X1 n=2 Tax=Eleginops maclovinus TaxID=56733 RepID=UPI0030803DB0